ncbi:M55 family metallopeptidase [Listeria sp. FSL L7-0091]|uniref:M55 family metallopeptidase n=1 Tax=Listeria farberi TaxID=2713500 RepID=A0A7X0ZIN6_9LIST|nr:M55 family metallopeptidase [Listeria farberi]MBC1375997.1 M55 family metallopeptidase [Listeria farberi]MBC1381984.1 M55 family metallopeptidase [Listeria farberi]MBC2261974.1 M55 family metallopeptidase [Listeria farberi]MBC2268272.1 M55 family metallopeptidase [Listeria farberi]MBC2288037.1 M55 family metallopeptidase [Listeria farberi]
MKLWISVDMEGINGLPDDTFVDSSMRNYTRGQKIMTEETNWVVEEALKAGYDDIIVNDSHSKMNNILIENLHEEARLITGDVKPFSMVQGLDSSADAAIFIGYHSRAGQPGVMSHSMTSGVRNFYINDMVIGEFGLNAYVAGAYGVPVILVSGDDYIAREAKELIPGIETAVVKEAVSRSSAVALSKSKAEKIIREKVALSLKHKEAAVLVPPEKTVLKIEFCNYGQAEWAALVPKTKIIEETTVIFEAENILEAYQAMVAMTELAMKCAFS